jgi:hypothetical protein
MKERTENVEWYVSGRFDQRSGLNLKINWSAEPKEWYARRRAHSSASSPQISFHVFTTLICIEVQSLSTFMQACARATHRNVENSSLRNENSVNVITLSSLAEGHRHRWHQSKGLHPNIHRTQLASNVGRPS